MSNTVSYICQWQFLLTFSASWVLILSPVCITAVIFLNTLLYCSSQKTNDWWSLGQNDCKRLPAIYNCWRCLLKTPLTSENYQTGNLHLCVLSHFNETSTELSEDKRVSGSKVTALIWMLGYAIISKSSQVDDEGFTIVQQPPEASFGEDVYITNSIMSLATLLDPCLKTVVKCIDWMCCNHTSRDSLKQTAHPNPLQSPHHKQSQQELQAAMQHTQVCLC